MAKIGIDISSHSAKSVENYKTINFDYVITLCDEAFEECPVFPNAKQMLHKSFPDPTATDGSEAEILAKVGKVRHQIKQYIKEQFCGKKIN
jgi:arsenate reductase